jgi:hypothetical protein
MSATYRYRVSIALPTSGAAVSHREPEAVRRTKSTALSGLTGALAGTAGGAALGAGAAGFVPGIGLGVLIAGGVLFGAFNGGLVGLLSPRAGRRCSSDAGFDLVKHEVHPSFQLGGGHAPMR